ncbi:MAG: winged helix-turn-helix domain-containing protein [Pseudomonadota bacterium]
MSDLRAEREFWLGVWHVQPGLGRISDDRHDIHLEPRVMHLLEILAEANGQLVTRNALFDRLWPNQEISDQTLSSLVSRLRRQLGDDSRQAQLIGTVPKRGYRLLQSVRWTAADETLETAADPVERMTPSVDAPGSPILAPSSLRPPSRYVYAILLAAMVLAIVLLQVGNGVPESGAVASSASPSSVAVLPFANLSGSPDADWFTEGIAEELLNQLAAVPGLKVASRTSSFRPRGSNPDVREIGADLNVRHVLEGSVRRDGEALRVAVQLVNVDTGFQQWSNTYDGEWRDILRVQQLITRAVVEQIRPRLLEQVPSIPEAGRVNEARAYELYLLGRYHWRQRTSTSLARAIELFERAAEIQPDYALAYTGLAESYLTSITYGDVDSETALSKAERLLAKALNLGPQIAETRLALGNMRIARTQWLEAERELLAALGSNPNLAEARMSLGNVYAESGRLSEAYNQYREALSLDPLHATVLLNLANVSLILGLPVRAEAYIDRAEAVMPEHTFLFGFRSVIYQSTGNQAALTRLIDEWWTRQGALVPEPTHKSRNEFLACGAANIYLGRLDRARACLAPVMAETSSGNLTHQYAMMTLTYQALLEKRDGHVELARQLCEQAIVLARDEQLRIPGNEAAAYETATANSIIGRLDSALSSLRRAVSIGGRSLDLIKNDPRLAPLRDRQEFEDALETMGRRLAHMQASLLQQYPKSALGASFQPGVKVQSMP